MSTGSRPPKRPGGGSRNPTHRPRKVAGRRDTPPQQGAAEPEVADESTAEPPPPPPPPPSPPSQPSPADEPAAQADADADDAPARGRERFLAGRRTTVALVVALVLLVGVLVLESWYLWWREEPTPEADRPVVTGEIAHRAAVEAARQDVTDILSYGYQDFDAQVDEAMTKMTPGFAEQYRETAAGARQKFIDQKLEQEFKVVGESVVQASDEQVVALLFLDQYVTHGSEGTSVTPYRALVTMRHTDSGWLVDDIETQ